MNRLPAINNSSLIPKVIEYKKLITVNIRKVILEKIYYYLVLKCSLYNVIKTHQRFGSKGFDIFFNSKITLMLINGL